MDMIWIYLWYGYIFRSENRTSDNRLLTFARPIFMFSNFINWIL